MTDKSISYFGFVDLWFCQDHIRDCSKGDHPGRGLKGFTSESWSWQISRRFVKEFLEFFCTCTPAHHQFVDYLNKPSFMKISGDHRRKPASSRLWPHFPLHLRQKDWNVPWLKVTSAWKKQAWHVEFVGKVSPTLVFWFKCRQRKSLQIVS